MPEFASRVYAAVVKVVDGGRVDVRGQREGRAHQTVFELGDEF